MSADCKSREGFGQSKVKDRGRLTDEAIMAKPPKPEEGAAAILTPQECRAARKALGWTMLRLAIAADVSPTTTWLFENRRRTPFPSTLSALRRALEGAGYEFSSPADDQARALASEIERLHTRSTEITDADEAKKVLGYSRPPSEAHVAHAGRHTSRKSREDQDSRFAARMARR